MSDHLVGGISSAGRQLPEINNEWFSCVKSKGPYIWDIKGKRYIDTILGFGSTILGHAPDEIIKAVQEQMELGLLPGVAHPVEEQAAQSLVKNNENLDKVIFVNSGSEAVHLACRVARAHKKKNKIIKLHGGYHGWYDHISDSKNDSFIGLFPNEIESLKNVVYQDNDIAAVIFEPALANSGCLLLGQEYLSELQNLIHDRDILIIADEVLMGYRIHNGLASRVLNLEPDIVTVGKAIGSGIPAAAVVSTQEVMAKVESGEVVRAGTYSGNPIACSAIIATLNTLEKRDFKCLIQLGNNFRDKLSDIAKNKNITLCTSGFGTVFTIWFSEEPPQTYDEVLKIQKQGMSYKLHKEMRERGVLLMPNPMGRLFTSFSHNEAVVDEILNAFEFSLDKI